MKKSILFVVMAVVALSGAAVNRFYLPDFSICPGETMQVAMILENDDPFTAFQSDLMLPPGLSVIEDDGEFLFDLTGRNASDQTIISKLREDGALRVVSFCMSVKPYSGNNGALVIINLHADEDFEAPATIALKHSFFSTTEGVELVLPADSCHVQLYPERILGDVNGDGLLNVSDVTMLISYVLNGCTTYFHLENAYITNDEMINVADVTALIAMILSN